MGIVRSALERRGRAGSVSSLTYPESWLVHGFGGSLTHAGIYISERLALNLVAVYACVRILSETMATFPLHVNRKLKPRGSERDPNHPLYELLHRRPNPEMTAFQLRELRTGHLGLWGNSYCQIERDYSGRPKALWPLRPDRMTVERRDTPHNRDVDSGTGPLIYRYRLAQGGETTFRQDEIWHTRGLSNNGIVGYSPIRKMREALGLAAATQEFGARFFSQGAHPGAVAIHPGELSDQAATRLRKQIEEKYAGLGRSHNIMLLEEDMKWESVGVPPEEAQFLETRVFQLREIARAYRVPLHMLGDLERATFSNIEQQSLDFIMFTMLPYCRRDEEQMEFDLFSDADRRTHEIRHNIAGLLRGDYKSRQEGYQIGRMGGWLSANDVRELEDLNPLPPDVGDVYLVPMNMIPAELARAAAMPPEPPPDNGNAGQDNGQRALEQLAGIRAFRSVLGRKRLSQTHRGLFLDAAARVVNRECVAVKRAVRKYLQVRDAQDFLRWLDEFYRDHPAAMRRSMLPIFSAYAQAVEELASQEVGVEAKAGPELDAFVRDYLAVYIQRHGASSLGQLQALVRNTDDPNEVAAALEQRLDEWEERRPAKIADRETNQLGNAVAAFAYAAAGISKLRWVAQGAGSCPYCQHLNGKVVGIKGFFIQKGEDLQVEGVQEPMVIRGPKRHPPLHDGCICWIVAA